MTTAADDAARVDRAHVGDVFVLLLLIKNMSAAAGSGVGAQRTVRGLGGHRATTFAATKRRDKIVPSSLQPPPTLFCAQAAAAAKRQHSRGLAFTVTGADGASVSERAGSQPVGGSTQCS